MGEEGLSNADIFRTKGVLQMQTSALFGAKTSNFLKFNDCSHGQGLSQFGHFADKIFAILCGRLLWTTQRYRSFLLIK